LVLVGLLVLLVQLSQHRLVLSGLLVLVGLSVRVGLHRLLVLVGLSVLVVQQHLSDPVGLLDLSDQLILHLVGLVGLSGLSGLEDRVGLHHQTGLEDPESRQTV
jgi:hypothetical protein